ncbi:MAG: LysM peptidoglycan-binding domain-containing protein [Anaerolineales bacterium]|nr:LysM peptidoglycan-binding domain-containing protein [Anaerolineales bacterium]
MKIPKSLIPARWAALFLVMAVLLSACRPGVALLSAGGQPEAAAQSYDLQAAAMPEALTPEATPTSAFPSRPRYQPGELVDYTAQTGDTLANLASRFNTSVDEILEANTFIPASATTMPPGMPMKIPIYYLPLWGSPYQILPDSLFINGPAQVGFDIQAFVNSQPGWLKDYETYVADAQRSGADIVDYVAHYYSVSPRLLLALLEYHARALSSPTLDEEREEYTLGKRHWKYKGVFMQLVWAANLLNGGYYGYRTQHLAEIQHDDGRIERFDPWQNAATASLHNYFNTLLSYEDYVRAISPDGFIQTYSALFGDPWENVQPHIPGSLVQPEFLLPFEPGDVWALTGGPHPAWGTGEPYAALDFAPPSKSSGCVPSNVWATAVADGAVVRSTIGEVMLDLDGDGDERTGWNVFYMHVRSEGRPPLGTVLKQGDPLGHPSCEGGSSTGTHIHIARKYNGEWMPAEGIGGGVLAFNMEGWVAHNGSSIYLGSMTRNSQVVTACIYSNAASFIQSDRKPDETR